MEDTQQKEPFLLSKLQAAKREALFPGQRTAEDTRHKERQTSEGLDPEGPAEEADLEPPGHLEFGEKISTEETALPEEAPLKIFLNKKEDEERATAPLGQ